jgi:hypothetical protein
VVQNWPGPANDQALAWKTPSRIAYQSDNQKFTKTRWGFEVTAKAKAYSWMKLLLDPEQSTKFDDPSLAASEGHGVLRVPPGKTAIDLCADFLTEIAIFAYEELKRKMGEDVVAVSPLEFWFTVPAVWSDRAKSATLRAAEKAAKNAQVLRSASVSSFLIAEPEAAAVATLALITQGGSTLQVKVCVGCPTLEGNANHRIQPGDSILICDCGGGTVVSHHIFRVILVSRRIAKYHRTSQPTRLPRLSPICVSTSYLLAPVSALTYIYPLCTSLTSHRWQMRFDIHRPTFHRLDGEAVRFLVHRPHLGKARAR